ncbi:unnamed protein product [Phaeothamnion confervicola]
MGAPALTTRGFTEEDFVQVAKFFDRAVTIAQAVKKETGPKIKDFRAKLAAGADAVPELALLKTEVVAFSRQFPAIGFDENAMRYPAK